MELNKEFQEMSQESLEQWIAIDKTSSVIFFID